MKTIFQIEFHSFSLTILHLNWVQDKKSEIILNASHTGQIFIHEIQSCMEFFLYRVSHRKLYFICISGYGLPLSKEPNKKGDIVVNFDILFPERLSQNTKDLLHDLLPN